MLKCPVTGEDMRHETLNGVEVDVSTRGLWLDKGELLRITEAERHAAPDFMWSDLFRREKRPPVDDDRRLFCPHCGEEMKVEKLHGVHIDWCDDHGVWLDDGELDAILNNLRLDPLFVGKVALRLWEARY
jgi:Zn-finger nucleic acid-binding protein